MGTSTEEAVRKFKSSILVALLSSSQPDYYSMFTPNNITPPTTSDYQPIQKALQDQERQIDCIKGDGNCLFRSISKELFGHQEYHAVIRHIQVDFIVQNSNLFKSLVHRID